MATIIKDHRCLFCSESFTNAAEKDNHVLDHFVQETCKDCNQKLLLIAGNLYTIHNAITCIRPGLETGKHDIELCNQSMQQNHSKTDCITNNQETTHNIICIGELEIKSEPIDPYEEDPIKLKELPEFNVKTELIEEHEAQSSHQFVIDINQSEEVNLNEQMLCNSFECNICNQHLSCASSLKRHKMLKHSSGKYDDAIDIDLLQHRKGRKSKLNIIRKTKKSKDKSGNCKHYSRKRRHRKIQQFMCSVCGKCMRYKTCFERHTSVCKIENKTHEQEYDIDGKNSLSSEQRENFQEQILNEDEIQRLYEEDDEQSERGHPKDAKIKIEGHAETSNYKQNVEEYYKIPENNLKRYNDSGCSDDTIGTTLTTSSLTPTFRRSQSKRGRPRNSEPIIIPPDKKKQLSPYKLRILEKRAANTMASRQSRLKRKVLDASLFDELDFLTQINEQLKLKYLNLDRQITRWKNRIRDLSLL